MKEPDKGQTFAEKVFSEKLGRKMRTGEIVELTPERSIVVGVGNIGGTGTRIVSLFRDRSKER